MGASGCMSGSRQMQLGGDSNTPLVRSVRSCTPITSLVELARPLSLYLASTQRSTSSEHGGPVGPVGDRGTGGTGGPGTGRPGTGGTGDRWTGGPGTGGTGGEDRGPGTGRMVNLAPVAGPARPLFVYLAPSATGDPSCSSARLCLSELLVCSSFYRG